MIVIIGFLAFVLWLGKVTSAGVAGLVLIGGIVFFLWIGHSIEMDEWKARCNRREYWKRGGPDQYRRE